jgi:restriction system protein
MTYFVRVMLGEQSSHAEECFRDGVIGTDFELSSDLTKLLKDTWVDSKKELTELYRKVRPDRSPVSVGLACGAIWTVSKGIPIGGNVISPTGQGTYAIGKVVSEYEFVPGNYLPHRRRVAWQSERIPASSLSPQLLKALRLPLTCIDLNPYSDELLGFVDGRQRTFVTGVEDVENASRFALEEILEDFLVANWEHTEFGRNYDILVEEGKKVGQQFPSDTGPIDILALRKDGKEYLVIELKRGRAGDRVVGQLLRYMGFVKRDLCQEGKTVRGAIVAHQDDLGLRNAISMVEDVDFYRYSIDFKLYKS